MFGYFHEMRNSSSFLLLWMNLFCEILGSKIKPSPIFYQYVTDVLFKEEVKRRFLVSTTVTESSPLPALDYQRRNAILYAAGYVVRHLSKRLERTSHPLKFFFWWICAPMKMTNKERLQIGQNRLTGVGSKM